MYKFALAGRLLPISSEIFVYTEDLAVLALSQGSLPAFNVARSHFQLAILKAGNEPGDEATSGQFDTHLWGSVFCTVQV